MCLYYALCIQIDRCVFMHIWYMIRTQKNKKKQANFFMSVCACVP